MVNFLIIVIKRYAMNIESPSSPLLNKILKEFERCQQIKKEVAKVVIGQEDIIHHIIIAILCNGHILLEGVPGVAKTTMIKAINEALGLDFKRIQFTPDLLPADLIGTLIYNPKTQEFETKRGPIFANLILADEINRAPAKVQAALLEAMQEQQVTIGSQTFKLDAPFLVFATQNPVEQEGTYQLPEAQVDRFMFKLLVTYPSVQQEKIIITHNGNAHPIECALNKEILQRQQQLVQQIYVDEKIIDYIVNIVYATRCPEYFNCDIKNLIAYGVSPRASINLCITAKAHAFLNKRHFVTPDDVKAVAYPTLRHRLIPTYEAEAHNITSDDIITKILSKVPAP